MTPRRIIAVLFAALLALLLPAAPSASALAWSSQVMYSSPAGSPNQGSLYARALRLEHSGSANGTMLATFEQYVTGTPVFPIYRSTDSGRTWSKLSDVQDTVNGWGLRYQPFLYELPVAVGSYPAGTILAAGNSIPADLSKTKLDLYASTDHGASWSFVSSIASGGKAVPNNGETPVWEPFLLAANGKLICYYSDQRDSAYGQKIVHQTSTDGLSWGSVVNDVTSPAYSSRPGMPVVTRNGATGAYLMSYEYYGAPQAGFAVYYRTATDPEAFGSATGVPLVATGGSTPTGSPYLTWLPTGGSQGTLVATASSSSSLFVNTRGGSGTWSTVSSGGSAGYSRSLVPLADGASVEVFTGGPLSGTLNQVRYSAVDLGGDVASGSTHTLVNVNSGKYLAVANSTAGTFATQQPADGAADQKWTLSQQSSGYYKVVNTSSGLLLGISGASLADGAQALQWTDNGTLDHEWAIAPAPAGGYTLTNRLSGKYLEIPNASTATGTVADQWGPTGCSCQRWTLG